MSDIVLVTGDNELNVAMTPLTPAQFEYVSNIRTSTTTSGIWIYYNFEVDIKNTGGVLGTVHPIAHYEAAWSIQGGEITPQEIAPRQTVTFKGSWRYDTYSAADPNFWFRPTYIESEAGVISFAVGKLGVTSIDIPAKITSGSQYWASMTVNLPYKESIAYGCMLRLVGVEYPYWCIAGGASIVSPNIRASYWRLRNFFLVSGKTEYFIKGYWREDRGGEPAYSHPVWAMLYYDSIYGGGQPLPKGKYNVEASISLYNIVNLDTGEYSGGGAIYEKVVGQVEII